jgi:hypothetical protein
VFPNFGHTLAWKILLEYLKMIWIRKILTSDGWRVVDDDDYNQSVGNPKRKV